MELEVHLATEYVPESTKYHSQDDNVDDRPDNPIILHGSDEEQQQKEFPVPVSDILTLNSVCRQLHAEASLLPFSKSIFHFDYLKAISAFHARLGTAQRGAITFISLGPFTCSDYFLY